MWTPFSNTQAQGGVDTGESNLCSVNFKGFFSEEKRQLMKLMTLFFFLDSNSFEPRIYGLKHFYAEVKYFKDIFQRFFYEHTDSTESSTNYTLQEIKNNYLEEVLIFLLRGFYMIPLSKNSNFR